MEWVKKMESLRSITIDVKIDDCVKQVECKYYKNEKIPHNSDSPHEPMWVELASILIMGRESISIMNDDDIEKIESQIKEGIENED